MVSCEKFWAEKCKLGIKFSLLCYLGDMLDHEAGVKSRKSKLDRMERWQTC